MTHGGLLDIHYAERIKVLACNKKIHVKAGSTVYFSNGSHLRPVRVSRLHKTFWLAMFLVRPFIAI